MGYSNQVKDKALKLYLDDVPKSEIARLEGMPSRRTLTNWDKEGVGLPDDADASTWEEYKEELETTKILQAKNRKGEAARRDMDDFYDEAVADLKEAITVSLQRLKSGDYKATASDPKKLLATLARLENRGEELQEFQREFAKQVFYVARDLMDESTFAIFVEKVKDIRNRQLTEIDPQGVRKLRASNSG